LASLGSCPSVNDSDLSSCLLCNHDRWTCCFCEQYLVNRSGILHRHGSAMWSALVSGWMKHVNWQLWEFKLVESYLQSMLHSSLLSLDQENIQLDIRNTSWMMMQTDQVHILDRWWRTRMRL
jgi:hypothetical protein